MDENRIEGAARNLAGQAQGAVGDLAGDAKTGVEGNVRELAGKAQQKFGEAKERAEDAAESLADQIAHLRAQVENLFEDKVTPALSGMAETAGGYARDAKAAAADQAENAAAAVKERPMLSVAIVAAVAFLLGMLSASALAHDRH